MVFSLLGTHFVFLTLEYLRGGGDWDRRGRVVSGQAGIHSRASASPQQGFLCELWGSPTISWGSKRSSQRGCVQATGGVTSVPPETDSLVEQVALRLLELLAAALRALVVAGARGTCGERREEEQQQRGQPSMAAEAFRNRVRPRSPTAQ